MIAVQGIDVSSYQSHVNWAKVKASGREFAYLRALEGTIVDTRFAGHQCGARDAGLLVGGYHFFHPGLDPIMQAEKFASIAGDLTLPPAMDLERSRNERMAEMEPEAILDACEDYLRHLEGVTGRRTVIYTGNWFWRALAKEALERPSSLLTRDLWISDYSRRPPNLPELTSGWKSIQIWQCAGDPKGATPPRCPGVQGDCDLDLFIGSHEDLLRWCSDSWYEPKTLPDFGQTSATTVLPRVFDVK